MERTTGFTLLVVGTIVLAALLIVALVGVPPPSRRLTIEEMRTGVDFGLESVRIQETYFLDLSQVDGGTKVAFMLHFPDGTSENVSFVFRTFMCYDVTAMSAHRDPQVVFRVGCGESSVLVTVV